jgi:hypothetical protein
MKITDKIVTSRIQPTQTNVVWHNPDTGELRMFGEKGWEVVGGKNGGYPVVTVEDNFNIEAKPNTFYNIKNSADSEVNINCSEGYSVDEIGKHIMFIFDGYDSEELQNSVAVSIYLGGIIIPDTTREGYNYKTELDLTSISGGQITDIIPAYFTNEVKTGNSVNCLLDMTALGQSEIIIPMNNIQVLNENVDYLVWVTFNGSSLPHVLTEVENDNEEYKHKYNIFGILSAMDSIETIYTNEPYITANNFYLSDGTDIASMLDSIEVKSNTQTPSNDIANEFVFNIKSPANIIFNVPVNWNNNIAPDLTQIGTYTISIVNGIGCYTFVNN